MFLLWMHLHVVAFVRCFSQATYAVARQAGGLEGCKPAKNLSFQVVVAGFAGNHHLKNRDFEEALPRRTLPSRNSCQSEDTRSCGETASLHMVIDVVIC